MKQILRYIFLLAILVSSFIVDAQSWRARPYELYYGIGLVNFKGDIGDRPDSEVNINFFETVSPTTNIGLRYKFNDRHSMTGSLFLGQLYASDHSKGYATRGHSFNSFQSELAGRYEFNVIKEKRRRTVYRKLGETNLKNFNLPTYLFLGLGGSLNTGNHIVSQGTEVLKTPYTTFAPVLQYGLGFKFRIKNQHYLSLELNYRLALSDKLDYAWVDNPDYGAGYGSWFDTYQTVTFNYIHQIRANRNGWPKLKRR